MSIEEQIILLEQLFRCTCSGGGSQIRRTAFAQLTGGVAIETREVTYLSNSRTADSFLASALCGGAIGKPNFGFPRARIRDIEPGV